MFRSAIMKIVSIIAHPMKESLIYKIWDKATQLLENKGHEIKRIDLYSLNFSPLLKPADPAAKKPVGKQDLEHDIRNLLNEIDDSQSILLAYPGWWNNMPGLLKTFFDRIPFVTTPAGFPVKLWNNKNALILTGGGAPFLVRKFIFRNRAFSTVSYILKALGVSVKGTLICDGIPKASDKKISKWYKKIEKLANNL
jgi:NAD(P)H dehydrogenase (quinone)